MTPAPRLPKHKLWWKYLIIVRKDPDRKSLPRIAFELFDLSIRTRSIPLYYFNSLLHKKILPNYRDFLCHREMYPSQKLLTDLCTVEVLGNKLFTNEFFSKRNIPVPRLLAYNLGETLYLPRDGGWTKQTQTSPEDWPALLDAIIAASASGSVFIKLINGSAGLGARKVSGRPSGMSADELEELRLHVVSGNFLFQETVRQHPDLNKLCASSVNTIRIDTFKDTQGHAEVISALLRLGLEGHDVDNVSQGGLWVGIESKTGALKRFGFRELLCGGTVHTEHPDSHVKFEGFPVPCFAQVHRFAASAADLLPPGLIGWDFAVTPEGPVLIEGNAVYYGMEMSDTVYGGYRNNPVFRKALAAFEAKRRRA
jgi:hypothetical protein